MLASARLMAQTGILPALVFCICTLSRAIVSYQVVQSPRMSTEERRERTCSRSHRVGTVHFLRTFCGSLSHPAPSVRERVKVVPSREKGVACRAVERGKMRVMPLPTGPLQEAQSRRTSGA
jgi:hypothetical protein